MITQTTSQHKHVSMCNARETGRVGELGVGGIYATPSIKAMYGHLYQFKPVARDEENTPTECTFGLKTVFSC